MKPYSSDGPDVDIAQPFVEVLYRYVEKALEEHDIHSRSQELFC